MSLTADITFESQNFNLAIDENKNKSGEGKLTNMSQDHIDYMNQICVPQLVLNLKLQIFWMLILLKNQFYLNVIV